MEQSSKERYISQKAKRGKKGKAARTAAQAKKPLAPFEKLVLFLLLVFLIAAPLSFKVNKSIIFYVGIVNYFILGAAITVKPNLVVDVMRKNNRKLNKYMVRKLEVSGSQSVFSALFLLPWA
jgi:hypothetical protein